MRLKLAHGFPMLALAMAIQDANAEVLPLERGPFEIDVNQVLVISVMDVAFSTTQSSMYIQGCGGVEVGEVLGYGSSISYYPPEDFSGIDTFSCFIGDEDGVVEIPVGVRVGAADDDEGEGEGEPVMEASAISANTRQAGRMIDNICGRVAEGGGSAEGVSQEIADACQAFGEMDSDARRIALSQITPEEILSMRQMMASVSQQSTQRVYQHQVAVRTGQVNRVAVNGNNLRLQNYIGGAAGEQEARWGLFTSVHYDGAEHRQTKYESKYEKTGAGASVGVDYRVSPNLFVGAAVDWSRYEVEYSSGAGEVENDVFGFTGFLTWYMNQFSLDVQLGYGTADFDSRRNITFMGLPSSATGSTSSDQYNFSLQTDWTYSRNALTLRPYLRVDYMSTEIDGYTESSGSPWAVRIGDQDVDQITSRLGLDATYAMSFDWGVFVPGLKLSVVSEASGDYSPVRFQLVGVTTDDGIFELQPDAEDSLYYQYDLSAVFQLKGGWSTFLSGQFISGYDHFNSYVISGGLRLEL